MDGRALPSVNPRLATRVMNNNCGYNYNSQKLKAHACLLGMHMFL